MKSSGTSGRVKKSGLKFKPVQKTGKIIDKQKPVKAPKTKNWKKPIMDETKKSKYQKAMKAAFPY